MELSLKIDEKFSENLEKELIQVRMGGDYLEMLDNLMNLANINNRSEMLRRLVKTAYKQNIVKK